MKKIKIKTIIKIIDIIYNLMEFRPVSRKILANQTMDILKVLSAQREMAMMNRKDIVALANKMVKLHGMDAMKTDEQVKTPGSKEQAPLNDRANMYG